MEQLNLVLDNGTGEEYDKALNQPLLLREAGPATIYTKDKATVGGKAGVMIQMQVAVDGELRIAQVATTAKLFIQVASIIAAKYGIQ